MSYLRIRLTVLLLLLGAQVVYAASKSGVKATAKAEPLPLYRRSIAEIAEKYTIIGDFSMHAAERKVADEVFWSYHFPIPRPSFAIYPHVDNAEKDIPATFGGGRAVEHINRGRLLFLEKKYDEARKTWLGARAIYGTNWPHHRRNDYFLGQVFLEIANEKYELHKDWNHPEVRSNFDNAATFLSWAFIRKEDVEDPALAAFAPKAFYNLAAIYWRYERFAGAYGAAEKGLNFLRATGRSEYRSELLRISSEAHVQNRTYFESVQLLDMVIRYEIGNVVAYEQAKKSGKSIDPSKERAWRKSASQVAAAFARIGDIYFDLRNYDLAEDAFALAARFDEETDMISPEQLVLRGESLFWLGRFSEARKVLHYAIEKRVTTDRQLPRDYAAWASLRLADASLAEAKTASDFNATRLAYYKVGRDFGDGEQGTVANVRAACLELPEYKGNNVQHARNLLEKVKQNGEIPYVLNEIAWSCQVASYTDRERTAEMLERVRSFAGEYPESRFLKQFAEPVREFQATKIQAYFAANDPYSAVSFFEKNRKLLFPKPDPKLREDLFIAYTDIGKYKSAAEFYRDYEPKVKTDLDFIRLLAVASELAKSEDAKTKAKWVKTRSGLIREAEARKWKLAPEKKALGFVSLMMVGSQSEPHLGWLRNLAMHWSSDHPEMLCDMEYPLLSRIADKGGASAASVSSRLDAVMKAYMPDLFKKDESCAVSFLEMENKILRGKTKELAARYVARQSWPLIGSFLHHYWMVAEQVHDDGDQQSARKLWQVIADKGPPKAPETGFAKARLDPTRTELEQMWD